MKKSITLIFLLVFGLTMQLFAQNDQVQVLQKCIDLPVLQPYYPVAADGNYQPVYIMQYPYVFPDGLEVFKFGKTVQIVDRTVIIKHHGKAYFLFHTFSFTTNTAQVIFDFYSNYPTNKTILQGSVLLNKSKDIWTITDYKLTRR